MGKFSSVSVSLSPLDEDTDVRFGLASIFADFTAGVGRAREERLADIGVRFFRTSTGFLLWSSSSD